MILPPRPTSMPPDYGESAPRVATPPPAYTRRLMAHQDAESGYDVSFADTLERPPGPCCQMCETAACGCCEATARMCDSGLCYAIGQLIAALFGN